MDRKCNEDQRLYNDQTRGHVSDYVVLSAKLHVAGSPIKISATEEIKLDGSEDSQRFLHRSRQGMRKLKVTEKLVGLPPETLNLHVRTVSTAGLSRSSSSGFTIRTSVTLPSGFTMTER